MLIILLSECFEKIVYCFIWFSLTKYKWKSNYSMRIAFNLIEVDYAKVNSQCTECNIEVIADRNLQIPGPECE